MLDKVAEKFGEKCYEVPVGFKHISAKMNEVDAVIGGESSGGLTVRGHIKGKDGVYAAALLVEMIAVTGKNISEIYRDIEKECGQIFIEERSYKFSADKKAEIFKTLMEEKKLPELPYIIDHVSYLDGCKVYFRNGGWVVARFSGTEPLLRIFCEMGTAKEAATVSELFEEYLILLSPGIISAFNVILPSNALRVLLFKTVIVSPIKFRLSTRIRPSLCILFPCKITLFSA